MSDDKIIDLSARRNAAERPDAEYVKKDDFGREMQAYLCSYDFADGSWCCEIWAYSMEDAIARVAAMRESLRVDGQLFTAFPA